MKLFFIISALVFVVGITKAEDDETTSFAAMSTTEEAATTEEDDDGMEPVEYCSKSKISTNIQDIDYSWTLDGVLQYMSRMGHSNFNKMQLQLNVTDLKFHEDQLHGNWSFAIFKEKGNSVKIQMTYTAFDADHLTVNGEVLVKLPCGTVLSPQLVCDRTHTQSEYLYHYHQYGNHSGYYNDYMNKTVFQLTWVLQDYVVQELIQKTREATDKTRPKVENGPPMVDEIDLLFHIEAVETMPTLMKLSQNCTTSTVASQRKNMGVPEPVSTTYRYYHSTASGYPSSFH